MRLVARYETNNPVILDNCNVSFQLLNKLCCGIYSTNLPSIQFEDIIIVATMHEVAWL